MLNKYRVSNHSVYELITQYNGLVRISEQEGKLLEEHGSSPLSPQTEEPEINPAGIKVKILSKYTRLLADKHPDIIPRILKGVGVDIGSKDPRVDLKSFLNLYWILDLGTANKAELIEFWTRILDPDNVVIVEKAKIIEFFDKLSKGRFSKSDTEQFSYAHDVWDFFEDNGLVSKEQDQLDITQLREGLDQGTIDIKVFGDIFTSGFDPNINQKDEHDKPE